MLLCACCVLTDYWGVLPVLVACIKLACCDCPEVAAVYVCSYYIPQSKVIFFFFFWLVCVLLNQNQAEDGQVHHFPSAVLELLFLLSCKQ